MTGRSPGLIGAVGGVQGGARETAIGQARHLDGLRHPDPAGLGGHHSQVLRPGPAARARVR